MSSAVGVQAAASVGYAEFSAVVIRCGCGDPDSHNGNRCDHEPGETCATCPRVCPRPRAVEDLGIVAASTPCEHPGCAERVNMVNGIDEITASRARLGAVYCKRHSRLWYRLIRRLR